MTEQLLSGAILQADVRRIEGVLDVKTGDGGDYNPFAPDAPVRLHGTAIRQAYDCVWHPNGRLYACSNQNDVNGQTGAGGGIPDVRNARPPEYLAIIERGKTYGFPNAARGEFVLMGGNPTDGHDGWTEIDSYPVGIQPPATFDASLMHRIDDIGGGSANGIIAYRASGALRGRVITCFYSAHRIYTFTVGDDGRVIDREPLRDDKGEPLRIDHPLDLCEHPTRGHLYVAAYGKQDKGEGGAVYFLERTEPPPSPPAPRIEPLVVQGEVGEGRTDWSGEFRVHSTGDPGQRYTVTPSADWLEVTPAGGALAAEGEGNEHRLRLAREVAAGTHYPEITVDAGGAGARTVTVHLHVVSRADQEYFTVSAGNSREVTAGEFPVTVALNGAVMSAAGSGAVRVGWEVESGEGRDIGFSDPELPATTATVQRPGRYVLRLAARRGTETRQARATLLIDVPGNEPPTLKIAADKEEIRVGDGVRLTATASDDGLPADLGGLRYRWSREGTGVGLVTFSAAEAASTSARFSEAGEYRLRCVVTDGVREAHREVVVRARER